MGMSKHGYEPTLGEELAASKLFYELSQRPQKLTRRRFYFAVVRRYYASDATNGSLLLPLPLDKRPSFHQVRRWWEKLRRLERPSVNSSRCFTGVANLERQSRTARLCPAAPRESTQGYSIKPGDSAKSGPA